LPPYISWKLSTALTVQAVFKIIINVPFEIRGTKSLNIESESSMMNYSMCLVFQVTKFNLFLQKPNRI